jgi:hypothetical protein
MTEFMRTLVGSLPHCGQSKNTVGGAQHSAFQLAFDAKPCMNYFVKGLLKSSTPVNKFYWEWIEVRVASVRRSDGTVIRPVLKDTGPSPVEID